jgi:hypothetical protein
VLTDALVSARPGCGRTNCWTRCTGSARRWGSSAACSGEPSPSSAPSGSHCQSPT